MGTWEGKLSFKKGSKAGHSRARRHARPEETTAVQDK